MDSVCVGLVHDRRMLLVRTRLHPGMWQPVGGRLVEEEGFAAAGVREVFEETGWAVPEDSFEEVMTLPLDVHSGSIRFFLVALDPPTLLCPSDEILEYRWVSPAEVSSLPAFPAATCFFAWWASHQL